MSKLSLEETRQVKIMLNQIKALKDTIESILFNSNSVEHSRYVSYKQMATIYNDYADIVKNNFKIQGQFYTFNTDNMAGYMDTLWGSQKSILEQVLVCTKMLYALVEGNIDFVEDEIENYDNFIFNRLRSCLFKAPDTEKEVQNALETLLIGKGLNKGQDYDRETGKFNFSGREYIPDFIIPKLKLCIEVKLLKDTNKKSKIIEEINADITAYSKEYANLLFVIYDIGIIRDEIEFKRDIENAGNVKLVIVKH